MTPQINQSKRWFMGWSIARPMKTCCPIWRLRRMMDNRMRLSSMLLSSMGRRPKPLRMPSYPQRSPSLYTAVTGFWRSMPMPRSKRTTSVPSNPNRIHVPPSVVIEKGKTSTTFAVVTTPGSAGLDTAIVTATYAGASIPEPFSVRTYAPNQRMPPTTVVTTNPSYWTEHLPFGKWVFGFQVRYAVSFVDAQGQETDRGPWTPWFGNPDYALPILFDVPTGPSNTVVKRRTVSFMPMSTIPILKAG